MHSFHVGEIGWALIRGLLYACTFLIAMTALGTVHSVWALLAIGTALTPVASSRRERVAAPAAS